ncbi:MAG: lipoprotein NlpD [Paraglaciecola sp.]
MLCFWKKSRRNQQNELAKHLASDILPGTHCRNQAHFFMQLILLLKVSIIIFLLAYLSACSSRTTPAPVSELYQGKTFRDFEEKSFGGQQYNVRQGDTLFSIAWYSGNDYRDLAKINNIYPPYNIFPGQLLSLKFPAKSTHISNNKHTGLTSKPKANQPVDRPKKQAYGKSEQIVNTGSIGPLVGKFPKQISNWLWPSSGEIVRGFSVKDEGNKGLDFEGSIGSPILAAADGKVVYTGSALRGFGKLIIVKHSASYLSAYAHNDKILVKEQQWIKAGQKIATMGRSGTDTVKLHFEVRFEGKSVDPLRYLPKR